MGNSDQFLTDFITGRQVPDMGAEANRQATEKKLVTLKGYDASDIRVDVPIEFEVAGEAFQSRVDLVVAVDGVSVMVFKCAAGSLGSREREAVSAARLLESCPIPLAVVSDGRTAIVLDTRSGKCIGQGWDAVPSKAQISSRCHTESREALSQDRIVKERLIFRTYDTMNVNRPNAQSPQTYR